MKSVTRIQMCGIVCAFVLDVATSGLLGAQSAGLMKPAWSISDYSPSLLVERPQDIRVAAATTWVSDNGLHQLLHIDATGKLLGTVGRRGSGPGEFGEISWFGFGANDSLYVWDEQQRRLTIMTGEGKNPRTETLTGGVSPMVFGRFRTGEWLVATTRTANTPVGVHQDSIDISIAASVRAPLRLLLTVPARMIARVKSGDVSTTGVDLPGSGMIFLNGCEGGFVVAEGSARSVRAYDTQGKLLRAVVLKSPPVQLSNANRTNAIATATEIMPEQYRRSVQQMLEANTPNPLYIKPRFLVGRDGRIWLRSYGELPVWALLALDGTAKASVPLPPNFLANQATETTVVGTANGDMGLRVIQRYVLPVQLMAAAGSPNALHPSLGRCESGILR